MVGNWQWNAWDKLRGTSRIDCIKEAIPIMHEILTEYDYGYIIEDPNRPGPNYYDDCKQFKWIDHLIIKHKFHLSIKGLNPELYRSQEEINDAAFYKLKTELDYALAEG